MRCYLKYIHPVTGNSYLFVDLHTVDGILKPVGCLCCFKVRATIFETKRDAEKIADYLVSLGYRTSLRRVNP